MITKVETTEIKSPPRHQSAVLKSSPVSSATTHTTPSQADKIASGPSAVTVSATSSPDKSHYSLTTVPSAAESSLHKCGHCHLQFRAINDLIHHMTTNHKPNKKKSPANRKIKPGSKRASPGKSCMSGVSRTTPYVKKHSGPKAKSPSQNKLHILAKKSPVRPLRNIKPLQKRDLQIMQANNSDKPVDNDQKLNKTVDNGQKLNKTENFKMSANTVESCKMAVNSLLSNSSSGSVPATKVLTSPNKNLTCTSQDTINIDQASVSQSLKDNDPKSENATETLSAVNSLLETPVEPLKIDCSVANGDSDSQQVEKNKPLPLPGAASDAQDKNRSSPVKKELHCTRCTKMFCTHAELMLHNLKIHGVSSPKAKVFPI